MGGSRRTARVARALAAGVLGVAGLVLLPAPAAQAAACGSADGITVVVDFHQLNGGEVVQSCVPDNGTASRQFQDAGHALVQVSRQPGFVCRIDGYPDATQDRCQQTPPASAYWSLWWSDGSSGTWTYANLGAYSLQVPEGGSVAFSWNVGGGRVQPGAAPPVHASGGSDDGDGGTGGGGKGDGGTGGGTGTGNGATPGRDRSGGDDEQSPSAGTDGAADGADDGAGDGVTGGATGGNGARGDARPGRDRDGRAGRERDDRDRDRAKARDREDRDAAAEEPTEGDSPSVAPEGSAATTDPLEPTAAGSEGLPAWAVPGVLALLVGAGGTAAAVRRRGSRP